MSKRLTAEVMRLNEELEAVKERLLRLESKRGPGRPKKNGESEAHEEVQGPH